MKRLLFLFLCMLSTFSARAFAADTNLLGWEFVCSEQNNPPASGWAPTVTHEISVGCQSSNKTLWLRASCPNLGEAKGETLFVEQSFMGLDVWLDQKKIYSYSGDLLPSRHHFVKIDQELRPQKIHFRVSSWANALGLRGRVVAGENAQLWNLFIERNIWRFVLSLFLLVIGVFSAGLWLFQTKQIIYFSFFGFTPCLSMFLIKFSELNFIVANHPSFWMWSNFFGVCFSAPFFVSFHKTINELKDRLTNVSSAILWFLSASVFIYAFIARADFGLLFLIQTIAIALVVMPILLKQVFMIVKHKSGELYLNIAYLFLASIVLLAVFDELKLIRVSFVWFALASFSMVVSFVFALLERFRKVHNLTIEQNFKLESLNSELRMAMKKAEQAAVYKAIAGTTQAMAHDIRKPLTMVQMLSEHLSRATGPDEINEAMKMALPEIHRATTLVNGMMTDVIEFGAQATSQKEGLSPRVLIRSAIFETFKITPHCQVEFEFNLKHQSLILADPLKVGRVFSNILSNGLQAMNKKGKIWFETKDVAVESSRFVLFCIGNSGPLIPEDDVPKVFDAFFTSGKAGGTGLGLAIVQKIITDHGGQVACRSVVGRGVEFSFSLPVAANGGDSENMDMPQSSESVPVLFER